MGGIMKTKLLNLCLFATFGITVMAPLTGVIIHKLASTLFLLLCLIHCIVYRKGMTGRRWLVLGGVFVAFASGICGMIFDEIPMILAFHKCISIVIVAALAIHIFVYRKKQR